MANEFTLFTPAGGGLGILLACMGSSSRAALPDPKAGAVYCVNNLGTDNVFLAFGTSSIVATTAYLAFPPGLTYVGVPNAQGSSAPTHIAGITTGASVSVQISLGSIAGP